MEKRRTETENKGEKITRVLHLYSKLSAGGIVNKAEEALRFGVNERSIQRDIEDIREYYDNCDSESSGIISSIVYDRNKKGYRLEKIYKMRLTNNEILAICKIMLDSRAFTKTEMFSMLDKLISCCVPKTNQKMVTDLIRNEEFHYVELTHKTNVLDWLWSIGQAVRESRYLEIDYRGIQGTSVKTRKLKPVAIMFSEYYFYLAAFIEDKSVKKNFRVLDDAYPTIYRIDRIKRLEVLDERFIIPYKDRFEEGEFRKRIQFMYGGKPRKVKFQYRGYSVDAVLDRLPTAKIVSEDDGVYTISAEVFGDGIDMWLRSQGDNVVLLE